MGTTYNVKFWCADSTPSPPDVQRAIDALLARLDAQVSTWRSDSELSRFNANLGAEWFSVSRETATIVARGVELHRQTGGASDVTVTPLSRLWGFGPGKASRRIAAPSDAALGLALEHVGADRLDVRLDPPALRKEIPPLEVDASSIAAGFAIDRIIDLLAERGVTNAMVELGGEVRAVGRRPGGTPWKIGVQALPPDEHSIAQVVPLADLALATSGDFHNFRLVDGERYAHIIDPRTGRPVPYRGAAVTVVAKTCFEADGLPTALFVMGPDAGYKWCLEHNVAAMFQEPGPDGAPTIRRTPRFVEIAGAAAEPQ
jgi:thiamine biosynthesis lipoprotein